MYIGNGLSIDMSSIDRNIAIEKLIIMAMSRYSVYKELQLSCCWLVPLLFLSRFVTSNDSEQVPVAVSRRSTGDIVFFNSSESDMPLGSMTCSNDNATYLVSERQCVMKEELHNGIYCVTDSISQL